MISFAMQRLVAAMAEVEGWAMPGTVGFPNGSRSYRNNNPLNLRKSPIAHGYADGFAIFKTDIDGWSAAMYDITQKCKGNTTSGLNGESTLRQLIAVWAPASDGNDPAAYLQRVCHLTGMLENTKLKTLL